jgi:hypothetical protein
MMPMPKKKITSKKASKKISAARKPAITAKKAIKKLPVKAKKQTAVAVRASSRSSEIGMQFIIAGSAICVMLLLGAVAKNTFSTRTSDAANAVPSTIGLEHNGPLSLSILFARKEDAGYMSITNESTETIAVSLPSGWKRTEVTGTGLDNVKQEIPVFGFTRWTLPGKAGMKLLTPDVPSAVFFDSTSASTAAVDLKTIDLTTLKVDSKVVLVQQQTLVPLWIGEQD